MHVVLAAGGTAGHIYPAINTAIAINEISPETRITILGTHRGLDRELVPQSGFPLKLIDSVPFPRKVNVESLRFPFRMRAAVRQTKEFFKEESVNVVVGFGGYASAPAYLAARSLGLCMIVHEANSTAGLANKLGARLTKNIALNYPGVLAGGRVIGMPLSPQMCDLDRGTSPEQGRSHFGLPPEGPTLLVFGGSQGAQSINVAIGQALPELVNAGISILHATGQDKEIHVAETSSGHLSSAGIYRSAPFIDRMDLAYAAADLSISRAGAMTVAEVSSVGIPSIFIPLPIGNGEQERNAETLVSSGAALICANSEFTSEWIRENVIPLILDRQRLQTMSHQMRLHTSRDAAQKLARWALACGRG